MKSYTTRSFRKRYRKLPNHVRRQARKSYHLFVADPYHRSLHFKRIHPTLPVYSARVSDSYRVIGELSDNEILWYWIGTHAEYDQLVSTL